MTLRRKITDIDPGTITRKADGKMRYHASFIVEARKFKCVVSGLPAGHRDACHDCDPCIDALAKQAVDRVFERVASSIGELAAAKED